MSTPPVHPAKAAMDVWRTTTPRLRFSVVRTIKNRDSDGHTVYMAHCGLARVHRYVDHTLTTSENHLSVTIAALQEYQVGQYRLVDFEITDDKYGTFIMERLP